MARSYKWQPHDKWRHAIPHELAVNEVGRTLCNATLTAGPDKWPDEARYWPTCPECDLAWRESEGILPWPRESDDSDVTSSRQDGTSSTSNRDSMMDLLALIVETLTTQGAYRTTARR